MSIRLLLALVLAILSTSRIAGALSGDIFAKNGPRNVPVFHVERSSELRGNEQVVTVRFTAEGGADVARETAVLRDGRLVRDELVQHQTGEHGTVVLEGERASLRFGKTGAEGDLARESLDGRLVATPAMLPIVVSQSWAKLARGEEVPVRLVAFSRRETVGFTLSRTSGGGPGEVRIKATPTSPFIRLLVDPMVLTFDETGRRLRAYEGRTALKRRDGNGWKDFEGVTLYRGE